MCKGPGACVREKETVEETIRPCDLIFRIFYFKITSNCFFFFLILFKMKCKGVGAGWFSLDLENRKKNPKGALSPQMGPSDPLTATRQRRMVPSGF